MDYTQFLENEINTYVATQKRDLRLMSRLQTSSANPSFQYPEMHLNINTFGKLSRAYHLKHILPFLTVQESTHNCIQRYKRQFMYKSGAVNSECKSILTLNVPPTKFS